MALTTVFIINSNNKYNNIKHIFSLVLDNLCVIVFGLVFDKCRYTVYVV